ncbi:DUF6207 family protein [Streptomyces sp. NPDC059837]|uniref:DUF6207 family protein n=1 Tax=Streptomyces sp. NPDC059837 TaxID=3346968 RepID=UPI00364B0C66
MSHSPGSSGRRGVSGSPGPTGGRWLGSGSASGGRRRVGGSVRGQRAVGHRTTRDAGETGVRLRCFLDLRQELGSEHQAKGSTTE